MEKTVVENLPGLAGNLKGIKTIPSRLQIAVDSFIKLNTDNELPRVSLNGNAGDVIEKMREIIPNRERLRGQDWLSSRDKDDLELIEQIKDRLYEFHGGRIGGLSVTKEKFVESIQVFSSRQAIDAIAELDHELSSLKDRYFLQFITVNDGKVKIAPGAEEKILLQYQVRASHEQEDFYQRVSALLKSINALEADYKVPGLTASSIVLEDHGYAFNTQKLKLII